MKNDPIVEETRQARAKLFAAAGEDLGKYLDLLQMSEQQDRSRIVTLGDVQKRHAALAAKSS